MPSTNSLAMPISMPSHGYFSRSCRQAVSPAKKSASPAAPVVSKSMPSVPASTMCVGDEVDVFDEHLRRLDLGDAGLVDLHQRQQLRPVVDRPVGLGVAPQVGHRAVLHRVGEQRLGDLHRLLLVRDVGLDRLVGVVDLPQLDHVDAERLLVGLQVLHPVADVLGPGAVVAHHDLVADVDRREARRRGVDVEKVVELVLRERVALGPLRRLPGALQEIGLDLGPGHLDERPVTHAGRDLRFQAHHLHCSGWAGAHRAGGRRPGDALLRARRERAPPGPWAHPIAPARGVATRRGGLSGLSGSGGRVRPHAGGRGRGPAAAGGPRSPAARRQRRRRRCAA